MGKDAYKYKVRISPHRKFGKRMLLNHIFPSPPYHPLTKNCCMDVFFAVVPTSFFCFSHHFSSCLSYLFSSEIFCYQIRFLRLSSLSPFRKLCVQNSNKITVCFENHIMYHNIAFTIIHCDKGNETNGTRTCDKLSSV